jgi:hypothetical protein
MDDKQRQRLVPAAGWFRMVRLEWARLRRGEKGRVLQAAGLPRQTANLVTQQVEAGEPTGNPVSFDVYERFRSALNGHQFEDGAGSPNLPPPFLSILDDKDWAWVEAGRQLRDADPGAWSDLLAKLEKAAHAAAAKNTAITDLTGTITPGRRRP